MSDYRPSESLLIAAYAGLGVDASDVENRRYLAATAMREIKAGAWCVAYDQGFRDGKESNE